MKKAYWVVTYREILDQEKLETYAKDAAPAIMEAGGKFLVRGFPTETFENGLNQRTVVTEFKNLETAVNAYTSEKYIRALKKLDNGAIRDIRIVEGAD